MAALYVVTFHVLAYHVAELSPHMHVLLSPLLFGHDAVDVFIVLSGFCLMLPVVRNSDTLKVGAVNFFKRRARRILPPYYLALIFALILDQTLIGHKTGTPWDTSVPVTLKGLVTHVMLLQDIFPTTWAQINSPMWSISVEWRIYFCFPLLVLAWKRYGPWRTVGTAAFVAYALVFAFNHLRYLQRFDSQTNGITPQYLCLFAFGVLGAGIAYSPSAQFTKLRTTLSWPMVVMVAFAASIIASLVFVDDLAKSDVAVGLFAASLLVLASTGNNPVHRLFSWSPLVGIGTFAYSLYLIHFPIIQIVWQYILNPLHLGTRTTLALHWLIGIPASVMLAYLFHLAFERPFMTQRKNETPAEVARDAALSPAP